MPRPVLLVTGGSRGIGASISTLAASRGYDVAVNYHREAAAAEAVVDACRKSGARAVAIKADMGSEADIVRLFREAETALGTLTHVANNAGVTGRGSPLVEATGDVIRNCIDINVTGAILVAREAARALLANKAATDKAIVNMSSVAATLGSAGECVWYAASKGAIDSLTIGLSKELAPARIRVNAVAPGLIDTEIHARSTGEAGRVARVAPMVPFSRAGTAEEVAETVLFLLSPASSYTTGAIVRVAGGR